ncbi:ComF family protein [Saccharopolyspora flava]|uniref:Predicted amidophosphoribosyltransferases n=1 Tax=Saccharopolyspora flava TaxID=95161 RepID=A0A1I6PJC5_9PSEU|nr:ComF family protein [Saccharopolyspora flava]SFS40135.1 Predicted amidophosphoribosyltransferases [Saccharopolyspora flava]
MLTRLRLALTGLVDLLLPQHCVGCDVAGTAWCRECAGRLGGLRRVERPLLSDGPPVFALGRYRGAARRAVLAYKEAGRRDLAAPLAAQLAVALRSITLERAWPGEWWLVPAPSRAVASRRRGGSHMGRIARHAAEALTASGTPARAADCLVTAPGAADSAGLSPQQRADNLAGRVLVRPNRLPPAGTRVALLDDVVTSGATAAGSAAALSRARRPVSVVLALTATAG